MLFFALTYSVFLRLTEWGIADQLAAMVVILGVISFLVFLFSAFYPPSKWKRYLEVYIPGVLVVIFVSQVVGLPFLILGYFISFLNFVGFGLTVFLELLLIYGMVHGGYRIRIHRHDIVLPHMSHVFNNFSIVQISDIHIGTFMGTDFLRRAFKKVMDEKPDMIVFTGDLVNNLAEETDNFMDILGHLHAPHGVYSILGNHDYADYVVWDSLEEKQINMDKLIDVHKKIGWHLLRNEHTVVEKDGEKMAVIGVENWGANFRFTKYGDLARAYAGAENHHVKILLSHDPSHFDKEVVEHFPEIDIVFSGHTHGMQFGIESALLKWSPVQWFYKRWAGLHIIDGGAGKKQHLHVNRGLGMLGYPGRVGIHPEISVITLKNK
jgi:predicted MPP superfamily phosphohydrolase